MDVVMIEGRILPADAVEAVYFDRGIYFGDGVYEVLRSYNGKIFALDEHFERLGNSLTAIGITGVDMDEIRQRVKKAFDAADIADAVIYFHITRGSGARNHNWDKDLEPNFFLTVTEAKDDAKAKSDGIAVSTYPDLRWKRCDIKSLNLLPNVLARQDAAEKGCEEAVFVDEDGFVTEGSHSCFFGVFGGKLQTAPLTANILPSITRKFVIKAAIELGMEIVEKSITAEQAAGADELFTAVTTKDIVGVVKFDGTVIGDGKIGQYTKSLENKFLSYTV